MINKNYNYVVVGASENQEKYGFKVLADLKSAGYKVFPVNPKAGELLGLKVYKSLSEISKNIDVVIFVVPPKVGEQVILEVKNLGIKKVWLQPGSESQKIIDFCKENGIECIHNACIMIERKN